MRALVALSLTALALALAPPASAQQVPKFGMPYLGPDSAPPANDNLVVSESQVAILDSALPRNTVRMRLDLGYTIPRPTRAEYFLSQRGLPLPEPRVNSYQDVSVYAEYAPIQFLSVFLETPYRWLNPEVNSNTHGYSDTNFGFKLCTWNSEQFLATLQLRFYNPTGGTTLGTNHWTLEPAFLAIWRPYDNLMFEGEVRYWVPLGGTDFAGEVLRYGAGISYGQVGNGFWYKPVLEGVGWSVLGGKYLAVSAPDAFTIQAAAGQTIVNGYLGMRIGMGGSVDAYLGYGRCFTGTTWARDFVRLEMRFFY